MDILSVQFDPNSARVAWNGGRVVMINGKEKNLNDLAGKLLKIAGTDSVESLTVGQRLDGIRVARLMKDAYQNTDQKIQNENIFLRALALLRDGFFTFFPSNARGQIEKEKVVHNLRSYSVGSGRMYTTEDALEDLDPDLTIQDNFR